MDQMKIVLSSMLSLIITLSFSQVLLEKTYSNEVKVGFDNNGDAIYFSTYMNSNGEIQCYNRNHELIQTTDLSGLFDVSFAEYPIDENDEGKLLNLDVQYSTDKLFDTDAQYEFVVSVDRIDSVKPNEFGAEYKVAELVYVLDSDGGIILKVDDGHYDEDENPIYFDGVSYKMRIEIGLEEDEETTEIYSLPGSLNTVVSIDEFLNNGLEINAYPNPAIEYTKIAYQLPEGKSNADLVIYDALGKEIQRLKVGEMYEDVLVNTSSFQEGTYIYHLISSGSDLQQGSFVVMK